MHQNQAFSLNRWMAIALSFCLFSLTFYTCTRPASMDTSSQESLSMQEPPAILDQSLPDPLEFLSRTLWHEPYIIFQASEGETISDHFLMALDTQQGKLHRIHQGYHARFWIQEAQLYFLHIDQYYTCPLSHWDQLSNIPPPDLDQARASLEYTLSTDLPSDLQVIEWANLHQVLQGSFTQPDQNQLLLISGRKEGYFLALYSMHPAPFELIWHERLAREMPSGYGPELMFNFQQVLAQDMSGNGCLEVFIHGVYAVWSWKPDPLIYLNFAKDFQGSKAQFFVHDISFSRLTQSKEGNIQLVPHHIKSGDTIYSFYLSREGKLQSQEIIADSSYEKPIERQLPLHQDFFMTGKNLTRGQKAYSNHSKQFPDIVFPESYDPDDPVLTASEAEYHRLRNKGIRLYIQKLDEGWNPFHDVSSDFSVSLNNETYLGWIASFPPPQDLINNWKRCFDVIPVIFNESVYYLAVNGFIGGEALSDNMSSFMMTLHDQSFGKFIDALYKSFHIEVGKMGKDWLVEPEQTTQPENEEIIHPFTYDREGPDQWHVHRILLPLPGQNVLWLFDPSFRSSQAYTLIEINSNGLQFLDLGYNPGVSYLKHEDGAIFSTNKLYTHLATFWGESGNGVCMEIPLFLDPLTGANISSRFPQIYREDLDRLYRQYYFFRYRASSIHPFELEEGLEFEILQYAEEIIYYGSQHRLEKITN